MSGKIEREEEEEEEERRRLRSRLYPKQEIEKKSVISPVCNRAN